jgi:hypothetical protein
MPTDGKRTRPAAAKGRPGAGGELVYETMNAPSQYVILPGRSYTTV